MDLNMQIGRNLRQLRQERNLNISQLAELCGVSGVMLSQIEKGTANPTINTIWKIANGLKLPYTVLLEPPPEAAAVIIPDEAEMQYSPDGNCRVFCYLPVSRQCKYEIFSLEVEPGKTYSSPGHPPRSRELVIVSEGEIEISIGGQTYPLQKGEALAFSAGMPHEYHNTGTQRLKLFLLNDYTDV